MTSQWAMPYLIMNLGGEMMYILDQRLRAQSINQEKGTKVLHDVISSLFKENLVDELFKPQNIHNSTAVRALVDKLAHSSIMRLSENSMNMLFDLMAMSFKYQLIQCSYPEQVMDVTRNHLLSMRKMVIDPPTMNAIDSFRGRLESKYASLTNWEMMNVRQTLLKFFQDKRVQVSIFLQKGYQLKSGTIVRPPGDVLPPHVEAPGLIRYLNPDGSVASETRFPVAHVASPHTSKTPITTLGMDMYSNQIQTAESSSPAPIVKKHSESGPTTAKSELTMLASLIKTSTSTESDTFKLNLFGSDFASLSPIENVTAETVKIDASKTTKPSHLSNIMDDLSIGEDEAGDDLLDLMDRVS